jgi:hypothetical protein
MTGSPSSGPPPPSSGKIILWDQSLATSFGVASQKFPGSYSTYNTFSADDFTAGEDFQIAAIHIMGMVSSGPGMGSASALNWEIYEDNLSVPAGYPGSGAPFWSISLPPDDPQVTLRSSNTGVSLTLTTPVSLPPGTYWLVFYPTMDFSLFGQWFWATAATANLQVAQIINPSMCFGCGPNWTSIQTCAGATDYDLAFRLDGLQSGEEPPPGPGPGPIQETTIPTLNQWGVIFFVLLLVAASILVIRLFDFFEEQPPNRVPYLIFDSFKKDR